jgi:hypothetical protein
MTPDEDAGFLLLIRAGLLTMRSTNERSGKHGYAWASTFRHRAGLAAGHSVRLVPVHDAYLRRRRPNLSLVELHEWT